MEKAMEGREMSTGPCPYCEQTALFKLFSYISEETNEKMLDIENADDNFLRKWEKELGPSDPKPVVKETFESFKDFRGFVNLDDSPVKTGLAFRGEPSASKNWKLKAKLFRLLRKNQSPEKAREKLSESFNNILGNRLFKLQEEPSVDHKFAIMQHYGTPTQLLDWTESADIALFFIIVPKS